MLPQLQAQLARLLGRSVVSRLLLIALTLVIGIGLAVGATLTASTLIAKAPTPSNQAPYTYGG